MRIQAKEKYRNAAGAVVPSVTTGLAVLAKPALLRWANKIGLQGIDMDRYKDELADVGTLTHYLIMCRLKEELPDVSEFTPEQFSLANACYKQYTDWEYKNPVIPVFIEQPFVSEKYQYGGRPDLYAICNRKLMLVDFKTNAKAIFQEMVYQVAAYRQLLIEFGYRVTDAVILRLGRGSSEGAEEKMIAPNELDVGFQIFIRCIEIYKLKQGVQL